MKHKAIALLALFCGFLHTLGAQHQQPQTGPWKDISELALPRANKMQSELPRQFRLLELDVEQLQNMLAAVPLNFSAKSSEKPQMVVDIPLPDGSSEKFWIYSDPIMHPDLARRFPEIQTFAGKGIDDPTATIRMDLSPHGFNAQILSDKRNSVYIAPVAVGDSKHNICYYKKDAVHTEEWKCFQQDKAEVKAEAVASMAGSCGSRREYRLALACTGEYAAFHGGTVALALAAMNTTMNRVNGVYERECSIRMNIVANTNLLIFLDGSTDPYSNSDGGTMLGENQTTCDMKIGSANYDIGHVFSTGGGGIASLGVPCTGSKAQGVTGRGAPIGDAFDIDYVAHEMGHQFGGNHTFNEKDETNCDGANVSPGTAFEPGSGSTIMAYAGICGAADVQSNSDDYFHAISLREITTYATSGSGSTCGTLIPVSNNQPTASAGADFTIPAGTPFKLTASGSDPDGQPLRYCWEQMDNQLTTQPPLATATEGPVFRSFSPTTSPSRFIPRLPVVLNPATPSPWEVLPTVSRTLNFRVTTRDFGPGGGCTAEDDMVVHVEGSAGPFTVNNNIGTEAADCMVAGENAILNWNVANTTAAPVSCANVDIFLSTDGGNNFGIQLANDVPNNGSATVLIPAGALTTQGRIMVMGANNIFFDINDKDFRIVECVTNRVVTDNPASGVYKASKKLETSGPVTVLNGTTARFYAGEQISMKPGFWAQKGSDFQAKIQSCSGCTALKPEALLVVKENPRVYFYEVPTEERNNMGGAAALKAIAFPNPFDQRLNLRFELPVSGAVNISLLDMNGRLVRDLYQADKMDAGMQLIPLETQDLAPGVYTCVLESNGLRSMLKVVKLN